MKGREISDRVRFVCMLGSFQRRWPLSAMASQISDRGQITIDKDVREQLGVEPGMIAYQTVVNGHLEIVFLPRPHRRSLYGVLKDHVSGPTPETTEELESAIREAVDEAMTEQARAGGQP
jgi:bifunctional DNA-binding transcriptional regulator/antitoxin component of YhaV-PrlF toxin-antitoxin module